MIRGATHLTKRVASGNKQIKNALPIIQACSFSSGVQHNNKVHGNLSDADRIFTNLYCDYDWHLQGAEMRVCCSSRLDIFASKSIDCDHFSLTLNSFFFVNKFVDNNDDDCSYFFAP